MIVTSRQTSSSGRVVPATRSPAPASSNCSRRSAGAASGARPFADRLTVVATAGCGRVARGPRRGLARRRSSHARVGGGRRATAPLAPVVTSPRSSPAERGDVDDNDDRAAHPRLPGALARSPRSRVHRRRRRARRSPVFPRHDRRGLPARRARRGAARSGPPASTVAFPTSAPGRFRIAEPPRRAVTAAASSTHAAMWWTHGDRLVHAVGPDGDLAGLFSWWRAHPSE